MKFSTLSFASLASLVAAENIKLQVLDTKDQTSQGFISPYHEGDRINYFTATESGASLVFEQSEIYYEHMDEQYNVGYDGNFLAAGPEVTPGEWTFNDLDVLETSKSMWLCNNLSDPHDHSVTIKMFYTADEAPNDSCMEVSLHRVKEDTPSPTSSPHKSFSEWSNTTTTEWTTVTDYTTYCPDSTTITVTTCENHKCGGKVITVHTATTVTVTGDCVIPVTSPTTAPKPVTQYSPTTAPKPVTHYSPTTAPTTLGTSTTQSVDSHLTPVVAVADSGAYRVGTGIAGFVAAAAFLF